MSKHKLIIFKILALFLSIASVIILLEMYLRIFEPNKYKYTDIERDYGTFCRFDEHLGWILKPGSNGRITHLDYSISVKINKTGFRDNHKSFLKSENSRPIWVFGDSFTFGLGVEGNECYTSILEDKIGNIDVMNMGVLGYGTDQEFLLLKKMLKSSQRYPKYIILQVYLANDLRDNMAANYIYYGKPIFTLDDSYNLILKNYPVKKNLKKQETQTFTIKQKLKKILSKYSRAFNWIDLRLDYIKDLKNRKAQAKTLYKKYGDINFLNKSYNITKKLLLEFNKESKRIHAEFIVLLVPDKRDFYNIETNLKKYFNGYERIINLGEKNNFKVIDLYPVLEKKIKQNGINYYFLLRDEHWTAAAHKLVGEYIADNILKAEN